MLAIIIVLFVCVATGWLIIKGYHVQAVLLISGIFLLIVSYVLNLGPILPKALKSSGLTLLDPIVYIDYLTGSYAGGLGLIIMVLVGFAEYMKHLRADEAVVILFTKPLLMIKSPYVLLFFSYFVGSILQEAVPSATGLAVLLMSTIYPLLIRMRLSPLSVAGVIASSLSMAYVPTAVDAIRASAVVNMNPIDYVYQYQGRLIIPSLLITGIMHVFWQRYCDKKDGFVPEEIIKEEAGSSKPPSMFAVLPFSPIILAIVFSHFLIDSIKLSIVSIVFICVIFSIILHFLHKRDLKEVFKGLNFFFKGMGDSFASVVSLLIAAGVFAHGIESTGAISDVIKSAQSMGMPAMIVGILFAIITLLVAIITGSGNAPLLAFIDLIPKIAESMGVNPVSMILPMQQASHMGRSLSPVSGVVIVVSSSAKLSPFAVVKRVSVPVLSAFVLNIIVVALYF